MQRESDFNPDSTPNRKSGFDFYLLTYLQILVVESCFTKIATKNITKSIDVILPST